MNELSVNVPGLPPVSAQSLAGQPVTVNYDIDNGEGEGSGVHLVVTLTPTLAPTRTDWLVRVENNNGDAVPAVNIMANVAKEHAFLIGSPYAANLRGVSIRRITCIGDTPFVGGQCAATVADAPFIDKAQVSVALNGATEIGATITGP